MIFYYSINNRMLQFTSQKKAKEYYTNIFNTIGECNNLKDLYPQYYNIIFNLLQNHPTNKANNIDNIHISKSNCGKYFLPFIIKNGQINSISYIKCITKKSETPIQNLKLAMREAISFQIINFKNTNYNICSLCKKEDQPFHVDHIYHFDKLYNDFMNNKKNLLKLSNIYIKDNFNRPVFIEKDYEFKDEWVKYHQLHAILRITCAKCNLSRTKK
jgi:hypothetical protein